MDLPVTYPDAIASDAVGLPAGGLLPFTYADGCRDSPVVLSVPHVGLEWPRALGPQPSVNLARNADFEVDAIYPSPSERPAATLRARFSRLVIDLNRAEDDVDPALVPDHPGPRPRVNPGGDGRQAAWPNRGVLWSHAVGQIPVLRRLPYSRLKLRIDHYHRPYHQALANLLEARRSRFGLGILVDAHSMPSGVPYDVVLGTLGRRSASRELLDRAMAALEADGLRVSIDQPYRGGQIVRSFGRPDQGIHALQVEVNRGLYMDEFRLSLCPAPPKSPNNPASQRRRWLVDGLARLLDELAATGPGTVSD
jgi:N-formylglutamate amidohydrolase